MKPFWNVFSLAPPLAVAILEALLVITPRSGAGDSAGRLGSGVLLILAIGAAASSGRLGLLGMVLNFVIILPIASLIMSN